MTTPTTPTTPTTTAAVRIPIVGEKLFYIESEPTRFRTRADYGFTGEWQEGGWADAVRKSTDLTAARAEVMAEDAAIRARRITID